MLASTLLHIQRVNPEAKNHLLISHICSGNKVSYRQLLAVFK